MSNTYIVLAALGLLTLARSMPAEARQGVIAGGLVSATSIGSRTEMSVSAATGFRVNRFAGFGVEVTSVPTLKPDIVPDQSALPASSGSVTATGGRATMFTGNVRIELPTARFIPYVVAGGGVANVKEIFSITAPIAAAPGIPVVIPPRAVRQSSTDLALTVGGGVSVLVAERVSVDADARYGRFFAARDLNVGRFGLGLSYRF
jgi:opacity protein-like surface antigen